MLLPRLGLNAVGWSYLGTQAGLAVAVMPFTVRRIRRVSVWLYAHAAPPAGLVERGQPGRGGGVDRLALANAVRSSTAWRVVYRNADVVIYYRVTRG